ncbi:MAG: PQQ-binding-like beta-propeller repeat protein [Pirellulales bacterium]|nr:PQQ-binding-like beta-propeller repeat protein [Pirellulales bacterium]
MLRLQLLRLCAGMICFVAGVAGQAPLTAQELISQLAANRLGLTRGWFAQAPLSVGRQQVVDAQFHSGELFVLTETGNLVSYNGVNGAVNWNLRLGEPNRQYQSLGVGEEGVAVSNTTWLYFVGRKDAKVIDNSVDPLAEKSTTRRTAAESLRYRTVPQTGLLVFSAPLPHVPTTGPAATSAGVFVPTSIGTIDRFDSQADASTRLLTGIQADGVVNCPPAANATNMAWMTDKGTVGLCDATGEDVFFTYRMQGMGSQSPVLTGAGVYAISDYGTLAFFPDLSGEPLWMNSIGAKPRSTPLVVKDAIYIISVDGRLFKLSAQDGRELWQINGYRNVLSVSPTKLYVINETRELCVLQASSGAVLGKLPIPVFAFPVLNPHSDQIFLVSANGVIQEFHETASAERQNYFEPRRLTDKEQKENAKPKLVKPATPGTPSEEDPANLDPFAEPGAPMPMPQADPAADPFADANVGKADAPPAADPAKPAEDPFGDPATPPENMPAKPDTDPFGEAPKDPKPPMPDDPFGK